MKNVFALGASGPLDETLTRYQVPEHLHEGIIRYVADGIEPDSSLLRSVIAFKLKEVVGEQYAFVDLLTIVEWFWHEAPDLCWGSAARASAWVESKARDRAGN